MWLKGFFTGETFTARDDIRWIEIYGNAGTTFAPSGFVLQSHSAGGGVRTDRWLWVAHDGNLMIAGSEPAADGDGTKVGEGVVGADTNLTNLGAGTVAINTNLVSDAADTDDLGSDAKPWKRLYVATSIIFDQANRNLTLTASEPGNSARTVNFGDPGASGGGVAYLDTAQTFTNKTLTTPVIASILYAAAGNAITFQDAVHTVVGRDTTDTLTGKTLSGNIVADFVYSVGGNAITFQDAVYTVIGRDTTDTLTSKSIDGDSNTLANLPISAFKVASQAQGDIIVYKSGGWTRLAPDSGKFLKSQGAGSDPVWATPSVAVASTITSTCRIEVGANDYVLNANAPGAERQLDIDDPGGTDSFVFKAMAQTLSGKTLTAPKFVDSGFIADSNGAELLEFGVTASAENHLKLTNKADGADPILEAIAGNDANRGIVLKPKGTGTIHIADTNLTFDVTNGFDIVVANQTQALTGTIPDLNAATDEFVFLAATQTLASKTLTSPNVGTQLVLKHTNDYTITWANPGAARAISIDDPGGDYKFVFDQAQQTLLNKILSDDTCYFADSGELTKMLEFELAGATGTKMMTLSSSHTDDRTITLPDATTNMVGHNTTDTLTNKTIDAGGQITNINADELDPITIATGTYGIPTIITVVNTGAANIDVFGAVCPFNFRVIDAWATNTDATQGGNWHLEDDGTNAITTTVAYGATQYAITRPTVLDHTTQDLTTAERLHVVNSDAADRSVIYIMIIRVD